MAKGYYEEGVAETVVAYKEWVEQDGKLYVSATEGLGGIWPERVSIAVEKETICATELSVVSICQENFTSRPMKSNTDINMETGCLTSL
jgi:hypothetical protein